MILRVPRELMLKFSDNREIQRFFADLTGAQTSYATKVSGADEDNIIVFDETGNLKDSGVGIDDVSLKVIDGQENNILVLDVDGDMKDGGTGIDELKSRAFFFARNY